MDNETTTLLASLGAQRRHTLGILDGLSETDLLRPVLPSGWSCLSLVRHLSLDVEEFWFQRVAAGDQQAGRPDERGEDGWILPAGAAAIDVFDRYRTAALVTDEIVRTTPLDTPPLAWPDDIWPDWRMPDLRTIVLHVITETACHAGHLDAARELIDGRQWMSLD